MANVGPDERERIADAIRAGGKRNQVAREFGRSPGTITTIAKEIGVEFDQTATKKAVKAKRDYAQAERLQLLNEGFDKARDILKNVQEPKDLQAWMIAVATGIDKRRLEDGEVTNRNENRSTSSSLEDEFKKLDSQLAKEVSQESAT